MKYLSLYDIIPQEYKDIYDKFYTNSADIEIKVKNGARIHNGDILFVYKFERIKEVITFEYRAPFNGRFDLCSHLYIDSSDNSIVNLAYSAEKNIGNTNDLFLGVIDDKTTCTRLYLSDIIPDNFNNVDINFRDLKIYPLVKSKNMFNKNDILFKCKYSIKEKVSYPIRAKNEGVILLDFNDVLTDDFKTYKLDVSRRDYKLNYNLAKKKVISTFYESEEELTEDQYKFNYQIKKHPINSSNIINGLEYNIYSYCFQLGIKDGNPVLSFFYERNDIKLKKKDKLILCSNGKTKLELEIISTPCVLTDKRYAIDFVLLDNDLKILKNLKLTHFILYKHTTGEVVEISNNWVYTGIARQFVRRSWDNVTHLEKSSSTFSRFVKTYINALTKIGITSEKSKFNNKIKPQFEPCFVYLMKDNKNGYFKIGMSQKPQYREKTLQSEKPSIELLAAKEFPLRKIAKAIEYALHNVYENKRVRGEWFNLSDIDAEAIILTLK